MLFMGKLTIPMAIFNSFLYVYQRVIPSKSSQVFAVALLTFGAALLVEKLFDSAPFGRRCASLGEVLEPALIVFLRRGFLTTGERSEPFMKWSHL